MPRRARTSIRTRLRLPARWQWRVPIRGSLQPRARLCLRDRDSWSALLAQVCVGLVEPVLARRREHVEVERILQGFCLVRQSGWDVEDFACRDHELTLAGLP